MAKRVVVKEGDKHKRTTHSFNHYEIDANKRASEYFGKNNNVSWNETYYPLDLIKELLTLIIK